VADDALPEDQQERQGEARDEHGVLSQSHARHGQSLVRSSSRKRSLFHLPRNNAIRDIRRLPWYCPLASYLD